MIKGTTKRVLINFLAERISEQVEYLWDHILDLM